MTASEPPGLITVGDIAYSDGLIIRLIKNRDGGWEMRQWGGDGWEESKADILSWAFAPPIKEELCKKLGIPLDT